MKHTLHRLKYLPLTTACVLAVAWLFTLFGSIALIRLYGSGQICVALGDGTFGVGYYEIDASEPPGWYWFGRQSQITRGSLLGTLSMFREEPSGARWAYGCNIPLPLVLTVLLPVAAGSFVRFRFQLWHWFAYTLLLAALLAFYFRSHVSEKESLHKESPSAESKNPPRTHILENIVTGPEVVALDPPGDDAVLKALRQVKPEFRTKWRKIEVVKEKIADYIDPPRFVETIGEAHLHHAWYKCTIQRVDGRQMHGDRAEGVLAVIYIDHQHYYVMPDLDDTSAPEETIISDEQEERILPAPIE